jgi:hypothetical protein
VHRKAQTFGELQPGPESVETNSPWRKPPKGPSRSISPRRTLATRQFRYEQNTSANNDSPAAKLDFTIRLVGMTMLAKNNDLGHIAHSLSCA